MSNFAFLQSEWSTLYGSAIKAEEMANTDSRTSCFYARRTLELAVGWLYKHDKGLRLPYQDHLSALIHEPSFRATAGDAVFTKAKLIKDLGNLAVHSTRPILRTDAVTATRELFHVCYWLARTYGHGVVLLEKRMQSTSWKYWAIRFTYGLFIFSLLGALTGIDPSAKLGSLAPEIHSVPLKEGAK